MALSKRRKAEIAKAQDEVANHPELVRMLVDGRKVTVYVTVDVAVSGKTIWDSSKNSVHKIRRDISKIREPYILRQVRSWLNRKAGQRSRHVKNV